MALGDLEDGEDGLTALETDETEPEHEDEMSRIQTRL
jgi:hypothetical protein